MKERLLIASWYEPSEKYPPIDDIVLCTINGISSHMVYRRTFALLVWNGENWVSADDVDFEVLEVLAWCDIYPYGYSSKRGCE